VLPGLFRGLRFERDQRFRRSFASASRWCTVGHTTFSDLGHLLFWVTKLELRAHRLPRNLVPSSLGDMGAWLGGPWHVRLSPIPLQVPMHIVLYIACAMHTQLLPRLPPPPPPPPPISKGPPPYHNPQTKYRRHPGWHEAGRKRTTTRDWYAYVVRKVQNPADFEPRNPSVSISVVAFPPHLRLYVTEHNPAPSPSGHPLLSGPPTLNDIHQILTTVQM